MLVLYEKYSTRGVSPARGEAECCISLSTHPLVLYFSYSTRSGALTITYIIHIYIYIYKKHQYQKGKMLGVM